MKNSKLLISTLVTGLLAVSGTASADSIHQAANRGNITPADSAQRAADNTLTKKVRDERGELLATQPGAIEVNTVKAVRDPQARLNRANSQAEAAENALRGNNADLAPVTPARARTHPAQNTLRAHVEGPNGELLATQPGRVEINQASNSQTDQRRVTNNQLGNNNQRVNSNLRSAAPISTAPLLKGEANRGEVTPANARTEPAPITLQKKIKDKRGELVATQPGEVELQESRRIVGQ